MNFDERSRIYPDGDSSKSCSISTPMEKSLLVIIALVVILWIGLSFSIVNTNSANRRKLENLENMVNRQMNVCYSPSCISEASNLLKSMDLSVDPCEDFYSFVCGNWIREAHMITNLESQFTRLTKRIFLRVKGILEDAREDEIVADHVKKTKDFYQACMDKTFRDENRAKDLILDLEKFGGWPLISEHWDSTTFDWSDLMVELFKNGYIHDMLLHIQVRIDSKNTSRTLIEVGQPSLGLPNRMYYGLPSSDVIAAYKKAIFKLAQYLKKDVDKDESMEDIEKAFKIENELAEVSKDIDLTDVDKIYNIMTVKEIESNASEIPWRRLFRSLLPPGTEVTEEDRILVTNPSIIRRLNDILTDMDEERKKSVANYMFYRTVMYAARFLNRELFQIVAEITETDRSVAPRLWELCVKTTIKAFPHSLTSSYVEQYLDNGTKILLDMMVEDLRNALLDNIQNATWLDPETKDYALLKVHMMKKAIAYQEETMSNEILNNYYSEINVTEDHFKNAKEIGALKSRRSMEGLRERRTRLLWSDVTNLLTANAYYYPGQNAIIVPVGVLQDTVFAKDRPNYINYGSLGMVVGHELTHAFDSIGSFYDAEGSYQMWWSNSSWNKFIERTNCYEDQYSDYYVPSAKAYVNGTLTLGENIADNGGLLTAYHAYKKLLKRIGSEKSLPGLSYDEKQMFWISFASIWCRKQTTESIEYALKHSVHTPSRYRVIGSLSNMKEFTKDFKCKPNATMNAKTRCLLWE